MKKVIANQNKCAGCGDDLIFSPELQNLSCPSCKKCVEIVANPNVIKHDVTQQTELLDKNDAWNTNKAMSCPNCGAKVVLTSFQTSSNCPYCSSALVAALENFNGLKPDAIIPFKINKEKALDLFKQKLKNKWLAPKKFKNNITAKEISAYYFPAFVFEANCSATYSGRLYENYQVKDKDGNTETRRKYFNIKGTKHSRYENVEIEASSKLSQFELNYIKPYRMELSKAYTNEFVYGYEMECYSTSVLDCHKQAQTIMQQNLKKEILSDYRYDGIDNFEMLPTFTNEKYSYVMLPIYRINYNHKNKNYSNVMNGVSGALGGDYPKSIGKILLIVLAIMAVVAIPFIMFIISFISNM